MDEQLESPPLYIQRNVLISLYHIARISVFEYLILGLLDLVSVYPGVSRVFPGVLWQVQIKKNPASEGYSLTGQTHDSYRDFQFWRSSGLAGESAGFIASFGGP